MRQVLLLSAVSGALLPLTGCGNSAYKQNESFHQEIIATVRELTDAFGAVKDKESAKAALPKITPALDRYEKLPAVAAALPKLNTNDNAKLSRTYIAELRTALVELSGAAKMAQLHSQNDPDIKAAAQRLQDITKAIQKSIADAAR